jgi:hypothetical protein
MRSSAADTAKIRAQKVKGETEKKSETLKDPTLEGKDETKIGRIQSKLAR